jgi:RNA polymerase sigma-32 factor
MSATQEIANHIRSQVNDSVILTKEDEIELVRRWQEDKDEDARNALITAHNRLIAGWATRFSSSGADFADLFNEGVIALISAADRFDPEKKNRFSSYAVWWILSGMQEAVHRDIYAVKIGRSRTEKKALRLLGTARQYLGSSLDPGIIQTISEFSGAGKDVIERIDGAIASRSISLNSTIGSDGDDGAEIGDYIECPTSRDMGAEEAVLNTNQRRILLDALSNLRDPRAAKILQERWLMVTPSKPEKSLQEIGADLSISAERVRQIERDAIVETREYLKSRGFDITTLLT